MNAKSCDQTQEKLAWGEELDPTIKSHIAACAACRKFSHELTELESLAASTMNVGVPVGFADNVMQKILTEKAHQEANHWLVETWREFTATPWGQAVTVGAAAILGFLGVFQFTLTYLLATPA